MDSNGQTNVSPHNQNKPCLLSNPKLTEPMMMVDSSMVSRKLEFVFSGQIYDCKLMVGKNQGPKTPMFALRSDLVVASEVFRAMLTGGFKEGNTKEAEITIEDTDPAHFKNFLMFLHVYTLPTDLQLTDFIELGILADKYLVTSLLNKCAESIKNLLGLQHVWSTLNRLVFCKKLADACNEVLSMHTCACLADPKFFEISLSSLEHFLSLEEMDVTESTLLDKCIALHKHRSGDGTNWMRVALRHLRLTTLSTLELDDKVGAFLTLEEQDALSRMIVFRKSNKDNAVSEDGTEDLSEPHQALRAQQFVHSTRRLVKNSCFFS